MKHQKVIAVYLDGQLVGKLALTKENCCAFEYDTQFIANGFSISPLELPLKPGVFIAKPSPFNGNFGVFDDSLPDGWGMLIMDRFLQKQGMQPRSLNLLDRLSLVGLCGRGALEYRPDLSFMGTPEYQDFEKLAVASQKILSSKDFTGELIDHLYYQGGSPGGARPKVFIHAHGKEWLVKFKALNDPDNIGVTEYTYAQLAKQCGIAMPETRLFDGKYFGVERFDRAEDSKYHVVSVGGLLRADYRTPCLDYTALFQLCRYLTHNALEMWKLYRLMVFNYLIGNKDDHAKNFSFIYKDDEWQLSPAYDILPSDGMNGYHTTSFNNSITPTKVDVIHVACGAGLDKAKAQQIFDEMKEMLPR